MKYHKILQGIPPINLSVLPVVSPLRLRLLLHHQTKTLAEKQQHTKMKNQTTKNSKRPQTKLIHFVCGALTTTGGFETTDIKKSNDTKFTQATIKSLFTNHHF